MNRSGNGLVIVVFRTSNGMGWHYCPKAALADPRIGRAMRYSDEEGYATLAEALNAVARDRSIRKTTPIEVEDIGPSCPALPAAAKTALSELEAQCNAPRFDPFGSGPFPRS
jgi:hypothetical protein